MIRYPRIARRGLRATPRLVAVEIAILKLFKWRGKKRGGSLDSAGVFMATYRDDLMKMCGLARRWMLVVLNNESYRDDRVIGMGGGTVGQRSSWDSVTSVIILNGVCIYFLFD